MNDEDIERFAKSCAKQRPKKYLPPLDTVTNRKGKLVEKEEAIKRVTFCLNQLEKYGFNKDYNYTTEIAHNLVIAEIIGALIAAEQNLTGDKD